jgi:hypothetical protein
MPQSCIVTRLVFFLATVETHAAWKKRFSQHDRLHAADSDHEKEVKAARAPNASTIVKASAASSNATHPGSL